MRKFFSFILSIAVFFGFSNYANAQYCTPVPSLGCSTGDYPTQFSLIGTTSSINNPSLTCVTGGSGYGGYQDLTADTCAVVSPGVYSGTVTANLSGTGSFSSYYGGTSTDTDNMQIYVDFNNDGIFETSESVGGLAMVQTSATDFSVVIPSGTPLGYYRMRLVYTPRSDALYPNINSCLEVTSGSTTIPYSKGEAIDYTLHVAVPVPAGPASVCLGSMVTLSDAMSGGSWSSSATSVATIGSGTGILTGVAVGSATITYTVGTAFSVCSVHINTITATAITGATTVCPSLTTALSDAITGGYWTSSNTAIATVALSGVVTGVNPGTTVVSYSTGCGSIVTTVVMVKSNISTHDIINADTLCNPVNFYISVCGVSSSYNVTTYFGDNTSSNTNLTTGTTCYANVFHTYTFPGTYTVKQVLYDGTIPQDSVSFPYEYYYCHVLPVKLYVDDNGDCIKDSTEPYNSTPLQVVVDSAGIPIDTFSVISGLYYSAHGMPGTIYSFNVISGGVASGYLYASCGALSDTIASVVASPVKYLALGCSGGAAYDLSVHDVIAVTGEHDQWGDVYASNNLCTPTNATVILHYSKLYALADAEPTPISSTDSTITWNAGYLSNTSGVVDLYYAIISGTTGGGPVAAGTPITTSVTITPTVGDVDTLNNYCEIWDTVKAGCDPNEMSVFPAGCIAKDTVTKLQYTISFMNVGNDTAFNIYVMDTLPATVNPASLKIVMASNTMNIAMINDGLNNVVKFDFPAINLLDSTVCPQCSGAVIFNVNTLPGLSEGTKIFNHAGVFFDDNPVVTTNTVENIMGGCIPASVKNTKPTANTISIFPNPTTNVLSIIQSPSAYTTFTITNSIGQNMIQQPLTTTQTAVNVATLPPGLYYITFRGDNGTSVQKFIKL